MVFSHSQEDFIHYIHICSAPCYRDEKDEKNFNHMEEGIVPYVLDRLYSNYKLKLLCKRSELD